MRLELTCGCGATLAADLDDDKTITLLGMTNDFYAAHAGCREPMQMQAVSDEVQRSCEEYLKELKPDPCKHDELLGDALLVLAETGNITTHEVFTADLNWAVRKLCEVVQRKPVQPV